MAKEFNSISYCLVTCTEHLLNVNSSFLIATFNNSPYSTHVNNFSIASFDIIRPLRRLCDKQGFTKFLTVLPHCSVGVTVAVDRYVNSSITFFGFYDI